MLYPNPGGLKLMTVVSIKKFTFFSFLFVLTLLTGCNENNITSSDYEVPVDISWGITLEQFNCSVEFPPDSELIAIADRIMNGQMIVLYSMENAPDYDINEIDKFNWDI